MLACASVSNSLTICSLGFRTQSPQNPAWRLRYLPPKKPGRGRSVVCWTQSLICSVSRAVSAMGAVCCKAEEDEIPDPAFGGRVKSWKRQNWRSEEPITTSQLQVGACLLLPQLPAAAARRRCRCLLCSKHAPTRAAHPLAQTMRETFWDTEPHYGGDRGGCCAAGAPGRAVAWQQGPWRDGSDCTHGLHPLRRPAGRSPADFKLLHAPTAATLKCRCKLPSCPPACLPACSDLGRAARGVRSRPWHGARDPGGGWRDCGGTRLLDLLR